MAMTDAEAALDMARVLDMIVKIRTLFETEDKAAGIRAASDMRSGIRTEIEHAERAAERVYDHLGGPFNPRDGGPM